MQCTFTSFFVLIVLCYGDVWNVQFNNNVEHCDACNDGDFLCTANKRGKWTAILVPNGFEEVALQDDPDFIPDSSLGGDQDGRVTVAGRALTFAHLLGHRVVSTPTGLGMMNTALTVQALIDHVEVSRILMYGIAGGIDAEINLGDVTIPERWAQYTLWSWQRVSAPLDCNQPDPVCEGPPTECQLPLECLSGHTRQYGPINLPGGLGRVWPQPIEIYRKPGQQELHWTFPVDPDLLQLARKVASTVTLEGCSPANGCLSKTPSIKITELGLTGDIFVDNAEWAAELFSFYERNNLRTSSVDMETAAAAIACFTNDVPFLAFRSVSDLAGGGDQSNEIDLFFGLASTNAFRVLKALVAGLPPENN
eukprot:TRINITY_DN61390_c0_g1_i1.p1 TRINITY_DN61390_c0_g1~~TRINITY_DN61390_c0_g1_i1.p1  ORF type:complete len:365 (+),score=31.41 TRINITY_DN61390_c0_g1_i1:40-1134(+)